MERKQRERRKGRTNGNGTGKGKGKKKRKGEKGRERERRTGVLCAVPRGKWPPNNLDAPWPTHERERERERERRRREATIEKKERRVVPRRKERERERKKAQGEFRENRCATIDRRLWLPTELSYTCVASAASAIGWFNLADYQLTTHRSGGVRSIKMTYRIMIRSGVNSRGSSSASIWEQRPIPLGSDEWFDQGSRKPLICTYVRGLYITRDVLVFVNCRS